jgi:hypothetical protein
MIVAARRGDLTAVGRALETRGESGAGTSGRGEASGDLRGETIRRCSPGDGESAGRRAIELVAAAVGVVARRVKASILGRLDRRDIVVVSGLGDSVEGGDVGGGGERRVGGIVCGGGGTTARCQRRRLTRRMRL